MDQRLFRIAGHRPHRLTKQDVPALARAMLAVIRRQGVLEKYAVRDVYCIRLSGPGFEVLVRSEDWAKVLPFLKDGTIDPLTLPVSQAMVSNRAAYYDASVLDRTEPDLYMRIVRVLDPLFPVDFPGGEP